MGHLFGHDPTTERQDRPWTNSKQPSRWLHSSVTVEANLLFPSSSDGGAEGLRGLENGSRMPSFIDFIDFRL